MFTLTVGAISPVFTAVLYAALACAILLIILFFLNQKVLPKSIVLEETDYMRDGIKLKNLEARVEYAGGSKGKGSLTVSTPSHISSGACRVTFALKAVDRRWVSSRNRRIRIVDISSNSYTVSIDGNKFVRKNGKFIDKTAGADEPISFETNIRCVVIKTDDSTLQCKLKTN